MNAPVSIEPPHRLSRVGQAVQNARAASWDGIKERLFTAAFSDLVYAQIWEDPAVDLDAMRLGPDHHVVTIASGGCNVMSYLAAGPARITAVDLNPAHVALTRLKLAAAAHLPSYAAFRAFLAEAGRAANVDAYDRHLAGRLDPATRAYWEKRRLGRLGRRRVEMFGRNLYAHGLLGRFIGIAHRVSRLHGTDPRVMLAARSRAEQQQLFDRHLAPLFDRRMIRWLSSRTVSLYGLGIPPAQFAALSGGRPMADVLRERLRRLSCDFELSDNYFARQAFGRTYGADAAAPLPPYLEAAAHARIRGITDRVDVLHRSFTEFLESQPPASADRYVLLDAQDWMNDAQLDALWSEITRTARPGARVVFRTAAAPSLLPGRVRPEILDRWHYDEAASRDFHARDRSAIYGGFHLYLLKDRPS